MIIRNFLFTNNILKYYIKSLYQIKVVVLSKIIHQALNTNIIAILKIFKIINNPKDSSYPIII